MTARALFWIGLPLRVAVAAMVWIVWRMCEPEGRAVDWRAVVTVGLDAGISL